MEYAVCICTLVLKSGETREEFFFDRCTQPATQEDLLCDDCRELHVGNGVNFAIPRDTQDA